MYYHCGYEMLPNGNQTNEKPRYEEILGADR